MLCSSTRMPELFTVKRVVKFLLIYSTQLTVAFLQTDSHLYTLISSTAKLYCWLLNRSFLSNTTHNYRIVESMIMNHNCSKHIQLITNSVIFVCHTKIHLTGISKLCCFLGKRLQLHITKAILFSQIHHPDTCGTLCDAI